MVEKSEWSAIGQVTYHFEGNFMLVSKIISKMIFELTNDDQPVVKSGKKSGRLEIGRARIMRFKNHVVNVPLSVKPVQKNPTRVNKIYL